MVFILDLDATERVYEYKITNRNSSLALNKNRSWLLKKKIDIQLLKKGAKILTGKHDFSTFRASSCSAKSPIRKINDIKIVKKNDNILIEFSSQSFLQNQVRSMVGCLKYLACKSLNVKEFKKFLNQEIELTVFTTSSSLRPLFKKSKILIYLIAVFFY